MEVGQQNNMRPGFESALRQYGEVIKDIHKTEKGELVAPDVDLQKLETVVDYYVSKRSSELGVKRETQGRIFDLQKEKQMVIERLKARLRYIDDPHTPEAEQLKDSMAARYDKQRNVYSVKDTHGRIHEITFGEMVADITWGLSYQLGEDAPRVHRKTYVVARAKRALMEYLDMQICLEEMERHDRTGNIPSFAYEPFVKRFEGEELPEQNMIGWQAEEMVYDFLTRLTMDGIASAEVRKADVYQDINNKIDFSIHRQNYLRGVDTQISDRGIGIQFTITRREDILKKKREKVRLAKKHLEEVFLDDLVLVSIPIGSEIVQSMQKWEKAGRPPGGPMRFWSQEVKGTIIQGVLQNLFSQEELTHMQAALESSSRKKEPVLSKKEREAEERIRLMRRYLPPELHSNEAVLKRALEILKDIQDQDFKGDVQKQDKAFIGAIARFVRRQRTEKKRQEEDSANDLITSLCENAFLSHTDGADIPKRDGSPGLKKS